MATSKNATEGEAAEVIGRPMAPELSYDWEEADRKRKKERQDASAKAMKDLYEPFHPSVERQLKKSGTSLTYIPVSEVITRLNQVFGVDGWSSEILRCERDALDPDFIVAHVRLSLSHFGDFGNMHKDGFGGQKIKRTKAGEIVDLGDEFKGAVSDALKKAAQQFGVGLYLARSEEALTMDAQSSVDPEVEALWNEFMEKTKKLDADGKLALKNYWARISGGAPTPKRENATADALRALITECALITTGGTFEDESGE